MNLFMVPLFERRNYLVAKQSKIVCYVIRKSETVIIISNDCEYSILRNPEDACSKQIPLTKITYSRR